VNVAVAVGTLAGATQWIRAGAAACSRSPWPWRSDVAEVPRGQSSAAATEDARRAFWAALAVVRNRTGARVAGGSQRWRAALKKMLPHHG
jgi:uncharacterized membrane protein